MKRKVQKTFRREFTQVQFVLANAKKVLLVAHSKPDPDAVGSVVALKLYIEKNYDCKVVIGCFDAYPSYLSQVLGAYTFLDPAHPDTAIETYDVAIGCDSVDRGFDQVIPMLHSQCVTIIFDHHHDISLQSDISAIDPLYASTTELLYQFFLFDKGSLDQTIATALLTGIIGDTGIFQHANTSHRVLEASANLVRHGASVGRIVQGAFANQKIATLNLWGRALDRAKYFEESGIVTTALTAADTANGQPTSEEVKEVATILTNAPSVKAAIIIFQTSSEMIKASLRAHKDASIDVSAIAHTFGGGGHPLAAGFEIPGRITILPDGNWKVI